MPRRHCAIGDCGNQPSIGPPTLSRSISRAVIAENETSSGASRNPSTIEVPISTRPLKQTRELLLTFRRLRKPVFENPFELAEILQVIFSLQEAFLRSFRPPREVGQRSRSCWVSVFFSENHKSTRSLNQHEGTDGFWGCSTRTQAVTLPGIPRRWPRRPSLRATAVRIGFSGLDLTDG